MLTYFHEIWIGYLTAIIYKKCNEISKKRCAGCIAGLKSIILHYHHQQSLLDKLQLYLKEVQGAMVTVIEDLYKSVEENLPHSDDKKLDKKQYCDNAVFFLTSFDAYAVFYGRFITEENDTYISDLLVNNFDKRKKLKGVKNI